MINVYIVVVHLCEKQIVMEIKIFIDFYYNPIKTWIDKFGAVYVIEIVLFKYYLCLK